MTDTTDENRDTSPLESGAIPATSVPFSWLGELLIATRKERGISQEELARRLGMFQEAIARWERERYRSASLERLVRVAEGLELSLRVSHGSDISHP